jgi:hypothetical protein
MISLWHRYPEQVENGYDRMYAAICGLLYKVFESLSTISSTIRTLAHEPSLNCACPYLYNARRKT